MNVKLIKSTVLVEEMRLDSSFHLSSGVQLRRIIQSRPYDLLGNLAQKVFGAGRGKRVYTSEANGVPFLSNSDVNSQNPFSSCKYISRKYGYDPKGVIEKGMILTGRVGAIGQVAYTRQDMAGIVASDNIIRIVANQNKILCTCANQI